MAGKRQLERRVCTGLTPTNRLMTSKLISGGVRLLLLSFIAFLLYYGDQLHVSFDYPYRDFMDNIYVRWAKVCVLLLILIEVVRLYYYGVVKNKAIPKLISNLATLLMPVILLLAVLEIAFMFIAQSQEGGLTLASHIWFERYWPPMTGDYRDTPKTDTVGKKKVLLVGDSFTAGHGLKLVEERYGNIVANHLGNAYTTYNLGLPGSDTRDEYARLEKFGVKPDILVLQYFPNDIEKVARDHGLVPQAFTPYSDIPGFRLQSLFRRSYLLNFLYWQVPHGTFSSFDDYMLKAYGTPAIINEHLRDLSRFVDYANRHHARLYVVLFPFLFNLDKTATYVKPVVNYFQSQNVPIVEVGKLIGDIDPKDRVVGRNDAHANPLVNQRTGEALFKMIQAGQKNQ